MCNLSKGVKEKGIAEGMAHGILISIKSLVKNMGISVDQAMSVLDIPEAERQNIWMLKLKTALTKNPNKEKLLFSSKNQDIFLKINTLVTQSYSIIYQKNNIPIIFYFISRQNIISSHR